MSSSDTLVHFGTGTHETIDRITVRWPSGAEESFFDLAANQRYSLTEPAGGIVNPGPRIAASTWFRPSEAALSNVTLHEQPYDDFDRQPLLPNKYSQLGPAVAWGDIDADGDLDSILGLDDDAEVLNAVLLKLGHGSWVVAIP